MLSTRERVQKIVARQAKCGYHLAKLIETNNEQLLLFEYANNVWMPLCQKIELSLFSIENDRPCFRATLSVQYDNQALYIDDNRTEIGKDCGYGSLVMTYIIELARSLKSTSIVGSLSPVDLANEAHPENRERVFHFYKKFGFEITLDEDGNSGSICLNLK